MAERRRRGRRKSGAQKGLAALLCTCVAVAGAALVYQFVPGPWEQWQNTDSIEWTTSYESIPDVPEYSGEPYVVINDNTPEFTQAELTTTAFEEYSPLDELGRCGTAEACVGEETMPTEERESISEVTPTGWENEEYDIVDGGYVYNRCHLIGFQLTGENANEENLITGTRYMNTEGMLPFEDMVAEYGVQMEAESVEDNGEGISFNVYVYNVQPDITIDYATGENWESTEEEKAAQAAAAGNENAGADAVDTDAAGTSALGAGSAGSSNESGAVSSESAEEQNYIINENTDKFHNPDCPGAADTKEKNKREYTGTREELIAEGYEPCGRCKP